MLHEGGSYRISKLDESYSYTVSLYVWWSFYGESSYLN